MQVKKYPNVVLENYSKVLVQLGLVLSLFIVYEFMQMKSYPKPIKELTGVMVAIDDSEQIVEFKPIEVQIKKTVQPVVPDKILKVEDDIEIEETVIESTETDETEGIEIDVDKEIVEIEEEEVVVEDVPFMIIEEVPVFPGCAGDNDEKRKCFSTEITKFVLKRFNSELATDLGLPSGSNQKIFVLFRIDKNGDIIDVMARAPHKKLKEEAIRVINLLPKMTPGKQRGRAVGVKYGLPITFRVE